MLSFMQKFLAPKGNPIGVDFGSDTLRMAQVQMVDGEYRLIAAAAADVPSHVRHDAPGRFQFFVDASREVLSEGNFTARHAVLGLPAAQRFIQQLRLAK